MNNNNERPAILGGTPTRASGPPTWPRIDDAVQRCLLSMIESKDWGRYHGPHVPELCRRLAELHGVEHVLACSSGTSAIELALRGVGVSPGDEVILAAYDFKSNFQNVIYLQATPVLVDLNPENWQLDTLKVESAITEKTRAIVISHLHGGVVDAPQVRAIADRHGIPIIEDACQNPGAILYGKRAGTWGDVGVISFGGSKLVTAGRGGAIMTSRTEIAERIKRQVNRGNDAYPLSEIQAAIIRPQFDSLDELNSRRCERVVQLCSQLDDRSRLTPLQLPTHDITPAYYKVGFRYRTCEDDHLTREHFVAAMRAEGIAFDPGFRANHLIHASRRFRPAHDLMQATLADCAMITLYHPVLLEDSVAMDQILRAIHKVFGHAGEIAKHLVNM